MAFSTKVESSPMAGINVTPLGRRAAGVARVLALVKAHGVTGIDFASD